MNNNCNKPGLTGIMRVKDESQFIERCVESCIDVLDELVIVYNDCSDSTPQIISNLRDRFPEKIRAWEYPSKILGVNLSKEEYEYAKSLPEDSPQLLCNYYNFALSKVSHQYAMKIDADQLYFKSVLSKWREVCLAGSYHTSIWSTLMGLLYRCYFSLYRHLSQQKGTPLINMIPGWFIRIMRRHYESYAVSQLIKGKGAISLSGMNLFCDDSGWQVCMGKRNDTINVLPPYNGEGDHLIFKVSPDLYYRRFDMSYYNVLRSSKYSLIEEFVHPYTLFYTGFAWFHLNATREKFKPLLSEIKRSSPDSFVPLKEFVSMSYQQVLPQINTDVSTLFQRILFLHPHTISIQEVQNNFYLLENGDSKLG